MRIGRSTTLLSPLLPHQLQLPQLQRTVRRTKVTIDALVSTVSCYVVAAAGGGGDGGGILVITFHHPQIAAKLSELRQWLASVLDPAMRSLLTSSALRGSPPFTVEENAKIPANFFKARNREAKERTEDKSRKKDEPDDNKLLMYRNDLVRVVDKAQFGDYGMVHTVQELYGLNTAGNLLSALTHLFTTFLQFKYIPPRWSR